MPFQGVAIDHEVVCVDVLVDGPNLHRPVLARAYQVVRVILYDFSNRVFVRLELDYFFADGMNLCEFSVRQPKQYSCSGVLLLESQQAIGGILQRVDSVGRKGYAVPGVDRTASGRQEPLVVEPCNSVNVMEVLVFDFDLQHLTSFLGLEDAFHSSRVGSGLSCSVFFVREPLGHVFVELHPFHKLFRKAQMNLSRTELLRFEPVHRDLILLATMPKLDLQIVELLIETKHEFVGVEKFDILFYVGVLFGLVLSEVFLQCRDISITVEVHHGLFVASRPVL